MRISTSVFRWARLSAMMSQQSALAKVQNHWRSGSRVATPSDDPIAYVHIQELQRAQSESEQFAKNSHARQESPESRRAGVRRYQQRDDPRRDLMI